MTINGIDGSSKSTRIKGLYNVTTSTIGYPADPVTGEEVFFSDTGKLCGWDNTQWWCYQYTSTSTTTTSTSSTTTSTSSTTTSTSTTVSTSTSTTTTV